MHPSACSQAFTNFLSENHSTTCSRPRRTAMRGARRCVEGSDARGDGGAHERMPEWSDDVDEGRREKRRSRPREEDKMRGRATAAWHCRGARSPPYPHFVPHFQERALRCNAPPLRLVVFQPRRHGHADLHPRPALLEPDAGLPRVAAADLELLARDPGRATIPNSNSAHAECGDLLHGELFLRQWDG